MMLSVIATELWLSAVVETEDTVGDVVSVVPVEEYSSVNTYTLLLKRCLLQECVAGCLTEKN